MPIARTLSPSRIIALVCIAIFIGAMDLTVASEFMPQVVVDFELSTEQFALAGWVVTMYLACALLMAARRKALSRIRRRPTRTRGSRQSTDGPVESAS